jgi:hypothetical protein
LNGPEIDTSMQKGLTRRGCREPCCRAKDSKIRLSALVSRTRQCQDESSSSEEIWNNEVSTKEWKNLRTTEELPTTLQESKQML